MEEVTEEQQKILDKLNEIEMLVSPTTLRVKHTNHSNYHTFMDDLINPLIESGEIVSVPNSTKGKLIQTREKMEEVLQDVLDGKED